MKLERRPDLVFALPQQTTSHRFNFWFQTQAMTTSNEHHINHHTHFLALHLLAEIIHSLIHFTTTTTTIIIMNNNNHSSTTPSTTLEKLHVALANLRKDRDAWHRKASLGAERLQVLEQTIAQATALVETSQAKFTSLSSQFQQRQAEVGPLQRQVELLGKEVRSVCVCGLQ